MRNSKDLAKAVIQECSVIITVGLCYGPSVLKGRCLCCRHVGTSRTTGCARTRARVSCATTPTFTNSFPILTESTTLEPRVSKPAHVRSSEKDVFFFWNNLSWYFNGNVNNLGLMKVFSSRPQGPKLGTVVHTHWTGCHSELVLISHQS